MAGVGLDLPASVVQPLEGHADPNAMVLNLLDDAKLRAFVLLETEEWYSEIASRTRSLWLHADSLYHNHHSGTADLAPLARNLDQLEEIKVQGDDFGSSSRQWVHRLHEFASMPRLVHVGNRYNRAQQFFGPFDSVLFHKDNSITLGLTVESDQMPYFDYNIRVFSTENTAPRVSCKVRIQQGEEITEASFGSGKQNPDSPFFKYSPAELMSSADIDGSHLGTACASFHMVVGPNAEEHHTVPSLQCELFRILGSLEARRRTNIRVNELSTSERHDEAGSNQADDFANDSPIDDDRIDLEGAAEAAAVATDIGTSEAVSPDDQEADITLPHGPGISSDSESAVGVE